MSGVRAAKAVSVFFVVACATAFSVWSNAVKAHDHTIPRVRLISQRAWQRGRLQSFCWITGNAGSNKACAGGSYSWPTRDRTPGEMRAVIRINKAQRPRKLTIRRWRRIDDKGSPIGDGKKVNYQLVTVIHRDRVVREARFRLPRRDGHVYLTAYGVWRDVVSQERQNATWNFHLKLR